MAYPCTNITIHENIVVTIHGPYISTFSLESGTLLQSTVPAISPTRQIILAKSFIMNVAVTLPRRRLVSVDHEKSLKVWNIDTLEILSTRELPKKAHQVLLTDDGATILVADKFGDVFAYPLVAPEIPPMERKDPKKKNHDGRKSLASHSNPSLGTLVLGHTSSLTTMLLTPNDEFLITADRDEHIRVSQYPKGYNIERFCMGHTKYVSALHLPEHLPGTLISAGGDRDLFLWDYQSGQVKDRLAIRDTVYSATKVQSQRRKFKRLETKAGTGWRARKRREREAKEEKVRREQANNQQATGVPDEDEEMALDNEDPHSPMKISSPLDPHGTLEESDRMITEDPSIDLPGGMAVGAARARLPAVEDVIAISRIATLQFESQYALVFSAVGATSLFFASFDGTKRWGPEEDVHEYKIPYPVLGFDVEPVSPPAPANPTGPASNRIWVTLDSTFVEQGADAGAADQKEPSASATNSITEVGQNKATSLANSIYLLEWRGGGTMIEVAVESAPLLLTLRSLPVIPASKADILALDLYGLLTSLPKTEELEEPDGAEREEADFSMETSGETKEEGALMNTIGTPGVTTTAAAPTAAGQQSREVKKSGRKKWQDKIESRQQQRAQKGTPSNENGSTTSRAAVDREATPSESHVKEGDIPSKARKATDAGNSEGRATKKLRTDGS